MPLSSPAHEDTQKILLAGTWLLRIFKALLERCDRCAHLGQDTMAAGSYQNVASPQIAGRVMSAASHTCTVCTMRTLTMLVLAGTWLPRVFKALLKVCDQPLEDAVAAGRTSLQADCGHVLECSEWAQGGGLAGVVGHIRPSFEHLETIPEAAVLACGLLLQSECTAAAAKVRQILRRTVHCPSELSCS